ncbi:hypothetical protein BpHYR1_030195 [Brachionus plicatilis]|uniref:Uncharacterized protein n=1 Tax=Brachionus plicatilis TaxID=10195 RepID=A0A3M7RMN9_BRAPC|nr:hypothetical protein BpHYR1_030195 [Brachionus plicatilis]
MCWYVHNLDTFSSKISKRPCPFKNLDSIGFHDSQILLEYFESLIFISDICCNVKLILVFGAHRNPITHII